MPFDISRLFDSGSKNVKSCAYGWLHFKWQPQEKVKFELLFTLEDPLSLEAWCVYISCHGELLPSWCSTAAYFLNFKSGKVGRHHLLSFLILLYQLHVSITRVLQCCVQVQVSSG